MANLKIKKGQRIKNKNKSNNKEKPIWHLYCVVVFCRMNMLLTMRQTKPLNSKLRNKKDDLCYSVMSPLNSYKFSVIKVLQNHKPVPLCLHK